MALNPIEYHAHRYEERIYFNWNITKLSCRDFISKITSVDIFGGTFIKHKCKIYIEGHTCLEMICYFTFLNCPPNCLVSVTLSVNGEVRNSNSDFSANNSLVTPLNEGHRCLLNEGNCLITAEVTIQSMDEYNSLLLYEFDSTFIKDFHRLFENQKFGDVTLVMAGRELHAHKCILASRSPVFAAMFEQDTEESKTNRVEIENFDAEVMEALLRFIYTGKVKDLNQLTPDLYVASEKYGLPKLKAICRDKLSSIENAAESVVVNDVQKLEEEKRSPKKFRIDYLNKIIAVTKGWRTRSTDYAHLIWEEYLEI